MINHLTFGVFYELRGEAGLRLEQRLGTEGSLQIKTQRDAVCLAVP